MVCIDHFTPKDYKISKDGKNTKLKAGAVPTIFNVFLIEVNENYDDLNNFHAIDTVPNIPTCCTKLREECEQMKCKFQSHQIEMNFKIDRIRKTKRQQARDIQSLKKKIGYLRKKLGQKQKKIDELNYVDVKVIYTNTLCLLFEYYLFIRNWFSVANVHCRGNAVRAVYTEFAVVFISCLNLNCIVWHITFQYSE